MAKARKKKKPLTASPVKKRARSKKSRARNVIKKTAARVVKKAAKKGTKKRSTAKRVIKKTVVRAVKKTAKKTAKKAAKKAAKRGAVKKTAVKKTAGPSRAAKFAPKKVKAAKHAIRRLLLQPLTLASKQALIDKVIQLEKRAVLDLEKARIQRELIMQRVQEQEFEPSIEWLHRDGTKAEYPSFLRHLPDAQKLIDRMNATGDPKGNRARAEARRIASEYGATVREVFTLFMSP